MIEGVASSCASGMNSGISPVSASSRTTEFTMSREYSTPPMLHTPRSTARICEMKVA